LIDELFIKGDKSHLRYIVFAGVITLMGYLSAILIFGLQSSKAQLLMITILLMPLVMKELAMEEKIIRKEGINHFWHNHKRVIMLFIDIFAGVFIAFVFIQFVAISSPNFFAKSFSFQADYLETSYDYLFFTIDRLAEGKSLGGMFWQLIGSSIAVLLITFLMSYFYGSGGVLFLVAGASVMATVIPFTVKSSTLFLEHTIFFILLFSLKIIPLGLACIAGGIISKAFVSEKMHSDQFRKVLNDGLIIFLAALGIELIIDVLWFLLINLVAY
jgi:hypothetical protein